MTTLVWDEVGSRAFETGVDHGVLYLHDGSAVPWNGLVGITERSTAETEPIYFDGKKVFDLVTLGEFSGMLRAFTYPSEFSEIEGTIEIKRGVYVTNQPPKIFNLSYRVRSGNDIEGVDAGYKIHLLYNVTALPVDRVYETLSDDPTPTIFEWEITTVPEEFLSIAPTAHIVIDSNDTDIWLIKELEEALYGSDTADAALPPLSELVNYVKEWARIRIIDNGDGTWTAISAIDSLIEFLDEEEGLFQILQANATYLDEYTYEISNTLDE